MRVLTLRTALVVLEFLCSVAAMGQPPATVQTPTDLIPIYAANPTVWAVADGDWCNKATWNTGVEPAAADRVWIPPGRKVNLCNEAATCDSIAVEGTLTTLVDRNTKLSVGTIQVLASGTYTVGTQAQPVPLGTKAEVVFRDGGFAANDPDEFGRGLIVLGKFETAGQFKTPFLRIASELPIGTTQVPLESVPQNWQVGDEIALADADPYATSGYTRPHRARITAISGKTITLDVPLAKPAYGVWDYTGAPRDSAGDLLQPKTPADVALWEAWLTDFATDKPRYLPHVANLSRNIVLRSENPAGKRGHILLAMGANVTAASTELANMGRTRNQATGPTNKIARYPWHMHHCDGVAADNLAIHDSYRWPAVFHNCKGGKLTRSAIVGTEGSGVMFETGTEVDNTVDGTFVCDVNGYLAQRTDSGGGNEGAGIWLSNPRNTITNNVVANTANYGYPIFNGSGRGTIKKFANNESYNTAGLTPWYLGMSPDNSSHPEPGGVIEDFVAWNWTCGALGYSGISCYQTGDLTFLRAKLLSCAKRQAVPWMQKQGWTNGDYVTYNTRIVDSEIQSPGNAIQIPTVTAPLQETIAGPFTVENTKLTGRACVYSLNIWQSSYGDRAGPRKSTFRNCQFQRICLVDLNRNGIGWQFGFDITAEAWFVASGLQLRPISHTTQRDELLLENFKGENLKYYFSEQSPDYVVPPSSPGFIGAQDNAGNPLTGLTNAQYWAQYGRAIRGEVSPTTQKRDGFSGFVLSGSAPPPQNQPPVAVNDSATTPYETPVTINVLANDSDPDGSLDPATVSVSAAVGGVCVPVAGGSVTFTPAAGFSGVGGFDYTVKNNQGAVSNVAHVTVTVQAKPPDPTDPCEQYKQQIAVLTAEVARLKALLADIHELSKP